jgi:hypothetical protein
VSLVPRHHRKQHGETRRPVPAIPDPAGHVRERSNWLRLSTPIFGYIDHNSTRSTPP